jgi:capsular polysaccharide transport system permease protein
MNRGWKVMRRSLLALFLREIRTRFGKYQLGYAWALLEPFGTILVLVFVFSALGAHGYPGIEFPLFLITGVTINSLFVEITNRSIKAMAANSTLFNYRPIRPVDTVISRTLLELFLHMGVYAVLLGGYVLIGGSVVIHDLPLLLAVFILLALFSCGIGIMFMLLTDAYEDADKVLPLLTRPLFFISGVFFSVQVIPPEYWPFLLWNPIFHAIELTREAVAPGYSVPQASLAYLAFSTMVSLTVSLVFYRRVEQRLKLR